MAPIIKVLQAGPVATDPELAVAESLGLPLTDRLQPAAADFILQINEGALELRVTGKDSPGPLRVDFSDPKFARRAGESLKKQNLGKAIGLKNLPAPRVLDATAGLGADGYLMAMAGCSVTLLERSPVVAALLQDGLSRGVHREPEGSATALTNGLSRMRLLQTDFMEFAAPSGDYDVVYLDPMFPTDTRSARSKKPMFLLQQLLVSDQDEKEQAGLLGRALEIAGRRVVVKRARLSPLVPGPEPDIQFKGSSSRFDVYLTGSG
jgi:16S rRNA (guanine1516-N2)-methyltransferase